MSIGQSRSAVDSHQSSNQCLILLDASSINASLLGATLSYVCGEIWFNSNNIATALSFCYFFK